MQFVQVTSCAINTMEHRGFYLRRLAPHIFLGLSTVHFLKCIHFIHCSVCIMQLISQTHAFPSPQNASSGLIFESMSWCFFFRFFFFFLADIFPPEGSFKESFPEASGTCTYSLKHGVLNRAGKNTEPKERET